MRIFVTGTDTNVGKTLIASWITLHTSFAYFKPIQTGMCQGTDSYTVGALSGARIYPEVYRYAAPLSPHLAAKMESDRIDLEKITLPREDHLIIEGAGGILVPLNDVYLMIDLIKKFKAPVILVARTTIGTINHTLLSLEALKLRDIPVLGVIMNGISNLQNSHAIERYGNVSVLAEFPQLAVVNSRVLQNITLSQKLRQIFGVE